MSKPFWQSMADDRDRYRDALERIKKHSADPEAREIARQALIPGALQELARRRR